LVVGKYLGIQPGYVVLVVGLKKKELHTAEARNEKSELSKEKSDALLYARGDALRCYWERDRKRTVNGKGQRIN